MADLILDTLSPASFRGVFFKFMAHQETGGRKSITYEYPNQDTRFVQDLGKMQRVFNMNCYVNSPGIEYFAEREAFKLALQKKGAGILIHPLVGAVNVFAKPYNLSEGIQELGYAVFKVQFVETTEAIFPSTKRIFASEIAGDLQSFTEGLAKNFEGVL